MSQKRTDIGGSRDWMRAKDGLLIEGLGWQAADWIRKVRLERVGVSERSCWMGIGQVTVRENGQSERRRTK